MSANKHSRDPFEILRDYEQRSLQDAAMETAPDTSGEIWTGIAYRIGEQDFVTQLAEIREVINPPDLTRVPGARSWIRGLANIHGTLLPVIDLCAYLGVGEMGPETADTRIVVVQQHDLIVGVVVDGVLGMRNFREHEETQVEKNDSNPLASLVSRAYGRSGRIWHVLSFETLLTQPEFLAAAVEAA